MGKNIVDKIEKIPLKTLFKTCCITILTKYLIEGPKLSSFKISGPIPQNVENRGTKTAIKALKNR